MAIPNRTQLSYACNQAFDHDPSPQSTVPDGVQREKELAVFI